MSEPARERCAWVGCDNFSEAEIAMRPLCSHHFYEVAQRRFSALLGVLADSEADRTLPPEVQSFLSELVSESTLLAAQPQRLSPELLEELLKLSVAAADLHKKIPRPLRLRRRISITVGTAAHGKNRTVESTTVNIGRNSACVETSFLLQKGATIWLERRDTKRKSEARVVWGKGLAENLFLAGIVILNEQDFWGLEKSHPEK
jgi:hypothetical protein